MLSKSISFRLLHPLNKFDIFFTEKVLKLDRLIEVKDMQNENIEFISLTKSVLKLDKFKELNWEHPLNIFDISVTNEVSKFDKSK